MFSSSLGKRNIEKDIERILVDAAATPTLDVVSFIDKLSADVIATATTVAINRLPTGVIADGFWVVIDPWTIECEIRKVTAISGTTLTMAALTYAHSKGNGVIFTVNPTCNIKWFGAEGDNLTDDFTALSRALAQAGTAGGGGAAILVPPGTYLTSAKLTIPHGVSMEGLTAIGATGAAPTRCHIKATGSFPASTPVIQLGGAWGTNQHGIRLSGIMVDCNAGLADYGVYAEAVNELCRIENCYIYNADEIGLYIDSTHENARNFELEGLWIGFPNSSGTEIGIYIIGGPSPTGSFTHQRGGSNITIIGSGGGNVDKGILLENYAGGMWDRIHLEKCNDGIYLGGASESCRAVTIQNCFGVNCTDLVDIYNNSNSDDLTFISLFRSGGTNLINDNITGKALTASRVGLYQVSGQFYLYGSGFRQSFDLWYQNNVTASQSAVILARADHVGAAPTGFVNRLILGRTGSITALWIKMNANRTAGTLTVEVYKNNGATGLTAVIDGTNPLTVTTTQPIGDDSFVAGDRLDLRITTDGSWTPTTADLRAGMEVET